MAKTPAGEAQQQAVDAVAEIADKAVPTEVELTTGVKMKLKKSPPFVIQQAVNNIKRPEIPKWYNEEKHREEENPNDPDYETAMIAYQGAVGTAIINALLLFGTEITHIPDNLPKVEDDEWVEALVYLDLEPPKTERIRRLMWLQTVALTDDEDISLVSTALFAIQGIGEEDVAKAIEAFRSRGERGSDNGSSPEENGANRHPVSRARRRAGASGGGKRRS